MGDLFPSGSKTEACQLSNGMKLRITRRVDWQGNATLAWTDRDGQHQVEIPALYCKLLDDAMAQLVAMDAAAFQASPKPVQGFSVERLAWRGTDLGKPHSTAFRRLYTRRGDLRNSLAWLMRDIPPDRRHCLEVEVCSLVANHKFLASTLLTKSALDDLEDSDARRFPTAAP